jgi:serine/threonine protein phosphatase PrpC
VELEYLWCTEQGKRSDDNRDFCGIGLRSDISLCIVLDGATSGSKSGDFACKVATQLIDWFVEVTAPITADAIIIQLREIHRLLAPDFRSASASYAVIVIEAEKPLTVLHAGDCLVGQLHKTRPVCWKTRPHTLVNAIQNMPIIEIAQSTLRNRLTRSLRTREFLRPEVSHLNFNRDEAIVIGTDGFWADLHPDDQSLFLRNRGLPGKENKDDCSALIIRPTSPNRKSKIVEGKSQNLYIVDSR